MQTEQYTTLISVPVGVSFSERETSITKQIHLIKEDIINKGFFYLDHNINHKSDSKASVTFFYQRA